MEIIKSKISKVIGGKCIKSIIILILFLGNVRDLSGICGSRVAALTEPVSIDGQWSVRLNWDLLINEMIRCTN